MEIFHSYPDHVRHAVNDTRKMTLHSETPAFPFAYCQLIFEYLNSVQIASVTRCHRGSSEVFRSDNGRVFVASTHTCNYALTDGQSVRWIYVPRMRRQKCVAKKKKNGSLANSRHLRVSRRRAERIRDVGIV